LIEKGFAKKDFIEKEAVGADDPAKFLDCLQLSAFILTVK